MAWQDVIFSIGNVVFLITLLPIVFNPLAYVPRLSSVPITVMLTLFVVSYASLGFHWSAIFAGHTVACWAYIAVKRGTRPSQEV